MLGVVVESVLLVVVEELEEFLHHYGEDTLQSVLRVVKEEKEKGASPPSRVGVNYNCNCN